MKRSIIAALGISFALTGFAIAATRTPTTTGAPIAKHGADDPAGDVKGEGPKHPRTQIAKHGADDPAGDVKGEGPKHPRTQIAKHGADDPAGDVKGEGPKHPKTMAAV
jgi:hypothetical protein